VDWTLGETWQADEPGLRVVVGPVAGPKLPSLLPGGHRVRQLEALYKFFFLAGADVATAVLPDRASSAFKLDKPAHCGRLGYTTLV
jgi:predicted component of type VI protein secretion system